MPTRALASKRAAPGPVRSTVPTIWWPRTTGDRTSGRSPSTRWRSVRQTPHAATRTRISPGPGSGTGRSSRRRGSFSIAAWAASASALTVGKPRRGPSTRSFHACAGQELPRAREMRRVHHPAPEGKRVHPAPGVLLEGGDQFARLLERLLRRREDVVDDRDLVRVDRDLPGEAHGDRVLALAAEAREVGATYPSGRPAIVSSRSAAPSGPQIGFILTQRSRAPNSRVLSQSLTTGRVATFRSGGTASSRSRISPSAGSARAFRSIFSLPPGTKWSDRRRRTIRHPACASSRSGARP